MCSVIRLKMGMISYNSLLDMVGAAKIINPRVNHELGMYFKNHEGSKASVKILFKIFHTSKNEITLNEASGNILIGNITLPFSKPGVFSDYQKLVLGIITIEKESGGFLYENLSKENILATVVGDRLGLFYLVEGFNMFRKHLKKTEGGFIGPRIAPGCPAFPMVNQKKIFEILDAKKEKLRISKSYMISPVKSASFILGISESPIGIQNLCDTCEANQRCIQNIYDIDYLMR